MYLEGFIFWFWFCLPILSDQRLFGSFFIGQALASPLFLVSTSVTFWDQRAETGNLNQTEINHPRAPHHWSWFLCLNLLRNYLTNSIYSFSRCLLCSHQALLWGRGPSSEAETTVLPAETLHFGERRRESTCITN